MWKYIGAIAVLISFAAMILLIVAKHEQWNKKVIVSLCCAMAASVSMTVIATLNDG